MSYDDEGVSIEVGQQRTADNEQLVSTTALTLAVAVLSITQSSLPLGLAAGALAWSIPTVGELRRLSPTGTFVMLLALALFMVETWFSWGATPLILLASYHVAKAGFVSYMIASASR